MFRNFIYIFLFISIIGCTNSNKECETIEINPNGESELALLMRDLHNNTLEIKEKLFLNDSTSITNLSVELLNEFKYNYAAIRTAKPTESNLRQDGIYDGYADLYLSLIHI